MSAQQNYVAAPRADRSAPPRFEIAEHPADEVGRVTAALERLSDRIEAAEHRSTLAISGVDQTVRGMLSRLESAEREQTAVAARFEGVVQDVQYEQSRIGERLKKIETDAVGPRSAEALKALESTLGRVAGHLYDGESRTRDALAEMKARVDAFEAGSQGEGAKADAEALVEAVVSRIGARLEEAEGRTSGALRDLRQSFAQLDERLGSVESDGRAAAAEARLEQLAATLTARVEASRSEMAERLKSAADGRFDRMERTLAEMSEHVKAAEQRSAQAIERMGREVIDMAGAMSRRIQTVEHRSADAIEQVGGEVARIAQAMDTRLARADTVQAQALERLGSEIARISERLAERIANSERRSAQAIDDVGEQVARVTERIGERHERASSELADRIRQSEERTAKLLEEAREKLERLAEQRAHDPRRNTYDPDESLFGEDPFPAPWQAPEAAPAAQGAFQGAFPGSVYRETRTVSSRGFAAAPAQTWTQSAPEAFSDGDFEAADEFVTVAEAAAPAEVEDIFQPAPDLEPEPVAEVEPPHAEAEPFDDELLAAEVAAIAEAPAPADEPLRVQALAAAEPVAEAFPAAPEPQAEAPPAFSLREAMQKARAAANAANGP
ncbi:MAG TPA: Localization factor PodJS, partial [Caulobacteraceae bacterium]|nr:Localization factor PodJS [Caulobacteraceae bacterium]